MGGLAKFSVTSNVWIIQVLGGKLDVGLTVMGRVEVSGDAYNNVLNGVGGEVRLGTGAIKALNVFWEG